MTLWQKHGGVAQPLPFDDIDETGSSWTDLAHNQAGRAACGWEPWAVPDKVSNMAFRLALIDLALMDQVEDFMATADKATVTYWDKAIEFWRSHPKTVELAALLGKTTAELDAIFVHALTFERAPA